MEKTSVKKRERIILISFVSKLRVVLNVCVRYRDIFVDNRLAMRVLGCITLCVFFINTS